MWSRLGGYRQRYAPHGAGAEDAEFFLRAGAMGWGGKLATSEPLFVYSWGTGQVSGSSDYQEADWLGWHPWITDKQHPFASQATPQMFAHQVRQYDEPEVSVIIPCGPNHVQYLVDALDSLEAQTFRKWEAIVVIDGGAVAPRELVDAYPFVRFTYPHEVPAGAGKARNIGAELARADLLLFLDADDWLKPQAIERMLNAWDQEASIIYTDYHGHAYMDDGMDLHRLRMGGRLHSYDAKTQEAIIIHNAYDYECEEAIRQPRGYRDGQFYIWSLITSLTPKAWHDEIGGFDESMQSWEDWDYWIRMARAGKCFVRIPEPLVDYRFYTGERRETGRQIHESLLEYLQAKYAEGEAVACSGCSKNRVQTQAPPPSPSMMTMNGASQSSVGPDDIVTVELIDGNRGNHRIVGDITKTDYGYRKDGDQFKMLGTDASIAPRKVRIVTEQQPANIRQSQPAPLPPAPTPITEAAEIVAPVAIVEDEPEPSFATWEPEVVDFTTIWGVNDERAQVLIEMGIRSITGLLTLSESKIETVLEVNTTTAKRILSDAASKA
jgi:glycosyltransferase involved in cell wall biosynthesis